MTDRDSFRLTPAETQELQAVIGGRPKVLVAARSGERPVALLRELMAVRRPNGWELIAWTDIQRGAWDGQKGRLQWDLVDGTSDGVELEDPGALPQAFAERVRASIAVQQHMSVPGDLGNVLLIGRRTPGTDEPISWQVEALGRCDITDPRVQEFVTAQLERLRSEFE